MPNLTTPLRVLALVGLLLSLIACDGAGFGRSSNADLSQLSISGVSLSPSFSSDTTAYEVEVSQATTTVSLTATLADDAATLTINGTSQESGVARTVPLNTGDNEVVIRVTAENESTRTYRIDIERSSDSSDNPFLSELDLAFTGLADQFQTAMFSYNESVNFWVNATHVTLLRANEQASPTVNGGSEPLSDNTASAAVSVIEGDSSITVTVLAGDLTTEQVYTVNINRSGEDELAVAPYIKSANPSNEDGFGSAIAVDNDTLVVGVPGNDSASHTDEDAGGAVDSGAVFVFERNGEVWAQTAYIKAATNTGPVITTGEAFGTSVALSGDLLAVGAPGTEGSAATEYVYVYERSSGDWSLVDNRLPEPEGAAASNGFGTAVGITDAFLIVGSPNKGNGSVDIFERQSDDTWELHDSVTPEAADNAADFGAALQFNSLVTVDEFIVGAPGSESDQGRAYLYRRSGNEWLIEESFVASNAEAGDRFGSAVSIFRHRAAFGAPAEASNTTGVATSSSSDNNQADAGAVYIFTRSDESDSSWSEDTYLKANRSGTFQFGSAVALSSGMLAVGAPGEDSDATDINDTGDNNTNAANSGAVYVFSTDESTWTAETFIKAPNTGSEDAFGTSVAFYGDFLAVGATGEDGSIGDVDPTENDDGSNVGAVYLVK